MRGLLVLATALAITAPSAKGLAEQAPRLVDANEIKDLVRKQSGQIVLLNFWATWCPPCLVEFPEIVSLEKAYRRRGLAVISVSADSPQRVDSDLLPFLDKHRSDFPIYVMETNDVEAFMHRIDPEWNGDLPATFFIGRKGDVVIKRFGAMSREQMERALEYLFEEPEP
ncbi:MAG TPA: TlpA disulfide reductase family protein [Vicinamibacteria bacterium]|jgi:thiol-disulfide isomerase/thioredoxin